jgi:hypothetical protein
MTRYALVLRLPNPVCAQCPASAFAALASVPAHCLASQAGPWRVAGTLHPLLTGVASLMKLALHTPGRLYATRVAASHRSPRVCGCWLRQPCRLKAHGPIPSIFITHRSEFHVR